MDIIISMRISNEPHQKSKVTIALSEHEKIFHVKKAYANFFVIVTEAEREAFWYYTAAGSYYMSQYLRGIPMDISGVDEQKKVFLHIIHILKWLKWPTNGLHLFKYLGASSLQVYRGKYIPHPNQFKVGDVINELGFASCAWDIDLADVFESGINQHMIVFNLPKDYPLVFPYAFYDKYFRNSGETTEFILPPGTTYVIEKIVQKENGKFVFYCELQRYDFNYLEFLLKEIQHHIDQEYWISTDFRYLYRLQKQNVQPLDYYRGRQITPPSTHRQRGTSNVPPFRYCLIM